MQNDDLLDSLLEDIENVVSKGDTAMKSSSSNNNVTKYLPHPPDKPPIQV
jgi:hypothetical protein